MRHRVRLAAVAAAAALGLLAAAVPSHAALDPLALCHKTVIKSLEKFKKAVLKRHEKCLDQDNKLVIDGPCPDAVASSKIAVINSKVKIKIASKCTLAQLNALGYRTDCAYGPATPGADGDCAALPVSTVDEFTECMKCWKEADFRRYIAILYASHAVEECGPLDDTSTTCSDLGCTTPLPEQRDLGDNGEGDCQKGLGKAGVRYMLKREKILEKCMLKGCDHGTCLAGGCAADIGVPVKLAKAESQKQAIVQNKCGGNRVPSTASTFCCKTMGNNCAAAATRTDCTDIVLGTVQEGKFCDIGNTCSPAPKTVTWWGSCPSDSGACPGATLTTMDDVVDCIDSTADQIVDELLCMQFPNGNACPTPAATPTATPTPTLELCGGASAPACNGACPTDAGDCSNVGGTCMCVGGLPTATPTPMPTP